MRESCRILFSLLFSCLLAGAPLAAEEGEKAPRSGFLAEETYAKLEKVEIREGVSAERWLGPQLNLANYQSILVDDVQLYPEPEPGPQVSADTLEQIRDYLTDELRDKVGEVVDLATKVGPGVLRMQTAVTGVEIKTEGMKGYEVVPVAAIFGGLKAMTGTRDRDVFVHVEARFVDSQSGELIGAAVRRIQGKNLEGKKDQLTVDDMSEDLDSATDDLQSELSSLLADQPAP